AAARLFFSSRRRHPRFSRDWSSDVCSSDLIGALAHITGGGLLENIPRVLPEGAHAVVDADAWEQPRLMAFLQAQGNIEPGEMARTFNCGIGMVVAVPAELAREVAAELESAGEGVMRIGEVVEGPRGCTVRGAAGTWSAGEDWSATHNAGQGARRRSALGQRHDDVVAAVPLAAARLSLRDRARRQQCARGARAEDRRGRGNPDVRP